MNDVNRFAEKANVAVIVLTYNEEENIAQLLDSVSGWASELFVLDSYSSDRTLKIARNYDCQIQTKRFENFSKQRNYALQNFPINSEWVLFLDADEWVPSELKEEISATISRSPPVPENGFYLSRRFVWLGSWIKRGYYPVWTLRLFRAGKGRCEDRAVNEHIIVDGATAKLKNDYVHEDRKSVANWVSKHIDRARLEAAELLDVRTGSSYVEVEASIFGSREAQKRWLRYKIWNRLPPLIRPFFYFFYRYFCCLGFLDGTRAFIYHFLQAFWFPMLIDIFYVEIRIKNRSHGIKDES